MSRGGALYGRGLRSGTQRGYSPLFQEALRRAEVASNGEERVERTGKRLSASDNDCAGDVKNTDRGSLFSWVRPPVCVFRRSRTDISVDVEQGFRWKMNTRFG